MANLHLHLRNRINSGSKVKSELDHYLDDALLPMSHGEHFDILSWWKLEGAKYPTLRALARDMLAIPVTTVASESSFSTSGRVISLQRSRLKLRTIVALMCTQSWLLHGQIGNFSNYMIFNFLHYFCTNLCNFSPFFKVKT